MVVWLVSYPRSGNTFYRVLLRWLCQKPTYSIYNDPKLGELGCERIVGHVPLKSGGGDVTIRELIDSPEVHFVKTHEVYNGVGKPYAIYIIRDGRDALVSHAHYLIDVDGVDVSYKQQLNGLIRSGAWMKHVTSWIRHRPGCVFVRYEDLHRDPIGTFTNSLNELKQRFDIDVEVDPDARYPSFEYLQTESKDFFRRGIVGAYKDEMTERQQRLFAEYNGKDMSSFGYKW